MTASGADVVERAVRIRWDSVLAGIRADALDCLQSTVALIADDAYGPGAHLALGAHCRFPAPGPDGVIGVQPTLDERMAQAAELLGLHAAGPDGPADAAGLRHMLDSHDQLYVVADAYDLGWLPYAGHRHMPHSFLLERAGSGYAVIDAYRNDTEWGQARPGAWTLPAESLDQVVAAGALAARLAAAGRPAADQDAAIARNAATARDAAPRINAYASRTAAALTRPGALERLVLDIWHLTRERILHTAWLGTHPAATQAAAHATRWQHLAAHSYLTLRRTRHNSTAPPTALLTQLTQLLHDDATFLMTAGMT